MTELFSSSTYFFTALTVIAVFVQKNKIAAPLREFFGWNRTFIVRVVKN